MTTEPICPHCGLRLKTIPKRQRKCPHCKETIYIHWTDDGKTLNLVTLAERDELHAIWDMETRFDVSLERWESTKAEFRYVPNLNDLRWKLLNQLVLEGYHNEAYQQMIHMLETEGKDASHVLDSWRETYRLLGPDSKGLGKGRRYQLPDPNPNGD